jgi:hypothetical protein
MKQIQKELVENRWFVDKNVCVACQHTQNALRVCESATFIALSFGALGPFAFPGGSSIQVRLEMPFQSPTISRQQERLGC